MIEMELTEKMNEKQELGFYRFNKNIKGIFKKDPQDAGYDIYVEKDTWIWPFKVTKIPGNLAVQLPEEPFNFGLVTSRSGMSTKGVFVIPGIVDKGYRGQISCIATRIGLFPKKIKKGERIAQLLVIPLINTDVKEYDNLYDFSTTTRGANGFGSSGIE